MLNVALQVPSTVVSGMQMNREGELLLATALLEVTSIPRLGEQSELPVKNFANVESNSRLFFSYGGKERTLGVRRFELVRSFAGHEFPGNSLKLSDPHLQIHTHTPGEAQHLRTRLREEKPM